MDEVIHRHVEYVLELDRSNKPGGTAAGN